MQGKGAFISMGMEVGAVPVNMYDKGNMDMYDIVDREMYDVEIWEVYDVENWEMYDATHDNIAFTFRTRAGASVQARGHIMGYCCAATAVGVTSSLVWGDGQTGRREASRQIRC